MMPVKCGKSPSARVPFTRIWMCKNYLLFSLLLYENRIQVYESWANLISVIKTWWVLTHSQTFCHLPGMFTGRWKGCYWLCREPRTVGIFRSRSNFFLRPQLISEAFTSNISWDAVSSTYLLYVVVLSPASGHIGRDISVTRNGEIRTVMVSWYLCPWRRRRRWWSWRRSLKYSQESKPLKVCRPKKRKESTTHTIRTKEEAFNAYACTEV